MFNGEGEGSVDRFHLECTASCAYDTERRRTDEVLAGGNTQAGRRSVVLTRSAARGSQTLAALTGATGVASFLASGVAGTTEFIASAGGVQSNAFELTPRFSPLRAVRPPTTQWEDR